MKRFEDDLIQYFGKFAPSDPRKEEMQDRFMRESIVELRKVVRKLFKLNRVRKHKGK